MTEKSVTKLCECCMGVDDSAAPGAKTSMGLVVTDAFSIPMMS